jgi:frataxin-like iron-binding protein CyaY
MVGRWGLGSESDHGEYIIQVSGQSHQIWMASDLPGSKSRSNPQVQGR